MLRDFVSENVLLSYKKISTLIPKIMNYKFGVGVGGEELLTLFPYFTTLIPKIMNSKFGGMGVAGYFSLQYLTKVYLQNCVQFLYPTFFKLPWKLLLKFVNNHAKTKNKPTILYSVKDMTV